MEFVLILSLIINLVLLILFIKLCMDVGAIKKSTEQTVFASHYINVAHETHKWAADRIESGWYDETLSYCKQSLRQYKIAQYYISQNRLGKIPSFIMEKYDGNSDLSEYVNQYIVNELKSIEDLAEKAKIEKAKNAA